MVVEDHGENGHAALLAQAKAGDDRIIVKTPVPYHGHDELVGHG